MIKRAVTELKDKKGSSRAAILKFILTHFKVGENIVSVSLKRLQNEKMHAENLSLGQLGAIADWGSFIELSNAQNTIDSRIRLFRSTRIFASR